MWTADRFMNGRWSKEAFATVLNGPKVSSTNGRMMVSSVDMWFATYTTGPGYSRRCSHPMADTFVPSASAVRTDSKQKCAQRSVSRR